LNFYACWTTGEASPPVPPCLPYWGEELPDTMGASSPVGDKQPGVSKAECKMQCVQDPECFAINHYSSFNKCNLVRNTSFMMNYREYAGITHIRLLGTCYEQGKKKYVSVYIETLSSNDGK
jgi:hypothetical protein